MEKLAFTLDDGTEVTFTVVEQTVLGGVSYLLVTDSEEDGDVEADAYILKDTSDKDSEEALYEFVEDDEELEAVSRVFELMVDDEDVTWVPYEK